MPSHMTIDVDPADGSPVLARFTYVDEDTCIGCKNCALTARNTFFMEDSLAGRARVFHQGGDSDDLIEEGYVLPVVAALDGRATVDDETGSIVYVFDDLVRGATASTSSNEGALAEEDIQFSNASQGQLAAAGVLGVANLGVAAAAVFYSTVGVTPAVLASLGPGGLAALRAVAGPLFAYAVAFNALPAARAGLSLIHI